MLNATLTVRYVTRFLILKCINFFCRDHTPMSHANRGWETFTDRIFDLVANERQGVVFMLWGGWAQKKVCNPKIPLLY